MRLRSLMWVSALVPLGWPLACPWTVASGASAPSRDAKVGEARSGDAPTWGNTSSAVAREAVAKGLALPLSAVLPTVFKTVAGQVLEVDLRQVRNGEWQYEFLVLTRDRRYEVVVVDGLRNEVVQVRGR